MTRSATSRLAGAVLVSALVALASSRASAGDDGGNSQIVDPDQIPFPDAKPRAHDQIEFPDAQPRNPDQLDYPDAQPRAHDEIPFPDAKPHNPDEIPYPGK